MNLKWVWYKNNKLFFLVLFLLLWLNLSSANDWKIDDFQHLGDVENDRRMLQFRKLILSDPTETTLNRFLCVEFCMHRAQATSLIFNTNGWEFVRFVLIKKQDRPFLTSFSEQWFDSPVSFVGHIAPLIMKKSSVEFGKDEYRIADSMLGFLKPADWAAALTGSESDKQIYHLISPTELVTNKYSFAADYHRVEGVDALYAEAGRYFGSSSQFNLKANIFIEDTFVLLAMRDMHNIIMHGEETGSEIGRSILAGSRINVDQYRPITRGKMKQLILQSMRMLGRPIILFQRNDPTYRITSLNQFPSHDSVLKGIHDFYKLQKNRFGYDTSRYAPVALFLAITAYSIQP